MSYQSIYIPYESSEDVILRCWDISEKLKDDYFQLNVSGKLLDFQYVTCRYLMVAFDLWDKESVFESIHNYFLDFFGDTVKYQWIANNYMPYFPRLPNLSLILIFRGTGNDKGNMKKLENIVSSSPIMEHIRMTFWGASVTLKPESKFYQVESIEIGQDSLTIPVNLGYFQGTQAFFICYNCKTWDLIEFLNRWKSGEAFQKLEYLKVELPFGTEFPQTQILNAIGVKQIDGTKQPPSHTVPRICGWRFSRPNTDPIISHTYVIRGSDNRVASISIKGGTLSFGVWNETEEGFLALLK